MQRSLLYFVTQCYTGNMMNPVRRRRKGTMGNSLIDPLQLVVILLIVGLVLVAGRVWDLTRRD